MVGWVMLITSFPKDPPKLPSWQVGELLTGQLALVHDSTCSTVLVIPKKKTSKYMMVQNHLRNPSSPNDQLSPRWQRESAHAQASQIVPILVVLVDVVSPKSRWQTWGEREQHGRIRSIILQKSLFRKKRREKKLCMYIYIYIFFIYLFIYNNHS